MLHLQYYDSVVKNNHINKILNNYKLKYSRLVNEIESKVNEMMKLYLKDILAFLENIEEVAEQKHKISESDKIKKELDLVKQKLKAKTYDENKIKTDMDLLLQENALLKLKINSLNQKISFLKSNNNLNSSQSSISPEKNISTKANKSMPKLTNYSITPKIGKKSSITLSLNTTSILQENNNKSAFNLNDNKKKDIKSEKNLRSPDKSKQGSKNYYQSRKIINANKFINNKPIKPNKNPNSKNDLNINTMSSKTSRKSCDKTNEIVSPRSFHNNNKINNKNQKNNKIRKNKSTELQLNTINIYNPLNTFNNTFNQSIDLDGINLNLNFIDIEKNVNEAFDTELKELEQDEANIELLLEQLSDEDDNEEEI